MFVHFIDVASCPFFRGETVKSLRARLTHFVFGSLFFPSSQWKVFLAIGLSIVIQTMFQLAMKLKAPDRYYVSALFRY